MRISALKHLAKIVGAFAGRGEVVVLGSSSLLASFPDLGETGQLVESSRDADLLVDRCDEALAKVIMESVGEESLFQSQNGYYADILRPAITDVLPVRWRERLVPLPDCVDVFCLDPHDLAVAKLQAGRPKDIALLRALLTAGKLQKAMIAQRIYETRLAESAIVIVFQRLKEAVES